MNCGNSCVARTIGPGHQLGEEGDEERKIQERRRRGCFPLVDIDRIGKGLEGVEGDAHRQDDAGCGRVVIESVSTGRQP